MTCYCARCPVNYEVVFVFSFVARPGGQGRFYVLVPCFGFGKCLRDLCLDI